MKLNIPQTMTDTTDILKQAGLRTPRLDARILLESAFSLTRLDSLTTTDIDITEDAYETFQSFISQRQQKIPISHIIYEKEFMSLTFYLEPGYFSPRPDTEHLVEAALKKIKQLEASNFATAEEKIIILDYATGTGAVGISIGYYAPNTHIYAYDKHIRPFENEDKVADFLGKKIPPTNIPEVNALHMKIDSRFTALSPREINDIPLCHIIVSNPPYIPRGDISSLPTEVLQEPLAALDGGIDGLDIYREILAFAKTHLINDGYILFEIGYHQGEELKDLLRLYGYRDIEIITDYNGLDRVVQGQKQS